MQIVLKRTEKASPTKIDLRTSFLGIRRDPPASFRIHSETHIFFTERISFVVHFENSHGFQVERAKKVGDRNKREKMKAKRLIDRVRGQRENSTRQAVSCFLRQLCFDSEN